MAYSFLDLAYDELKKAQFPMTYQEIWEAGKTSGSVARIKTMGITPWQSLGARLYVDVRDNSNSKFIKIGSRPARFFLKERQHELANDVITKIELQEIRKAEPKTTTKEICIHF